MRSRLALVSCAAAILGGCAETRRLNATTAVVECVESSSPWSRPLRIWAIEPAGDRLVYDYASAMTLGNCRARLQPGRYRIEVCFRGQQECLLREERELEAGTTYALHIPCVQEGWIRRCDQSRLLLEPPPA
ncbi:hypothetical protein [Roseomonas sp. HF4]|uniref:hypothetical protein n=1 Tax=Roseomonas sp. HF4 TaxID=2562313 RepID=UPI0010C12B32|nr:hypothetical protein [Roseomonas sp. HF4]